MGTKGGRADQYENVQTKQILDFHNVRGVGLSGLDIKMRDIWQAQEIEATSEWKPEDEHS